MADKSTEMVRDLAAYFDWDAKSEQVSEITKALREARADGIEEGAAIGGISPTLTARRRAAALRKKK
jgi:hypothetical protein